LGRLVSAHPWLEPAGLGHQRHRRICHAIAFYQQVVLSLTASEWGALGALPVPARKV
jgi:hypothetical protein